MSIKVGSRTEGPVTIETFWDFLDAALWRMFEMFGNKTSGEFRRSKIFINHNGESIRVKQVSLERFIDDSLVLVISTETDLPGEAKPGVPF